MLVKKMDFFFRRFVLKNNVYLLACLSFRVGFDVNLCRRGCCCWRSFVLVIFGSDVAATAVIRL